ncbi:MAG: sulfotransferase domain-containing protein [bacterium]
MWIFCCGMQRSGSTLQFQITARLVEEAGLGKRVDWVKPQHFRKLRKQFAEDASWKVFKNHVCTDKMRKEFHRGNAMGIYCYRDLRDVMVSTMRKYEMSFAQLFDNGFVDDLLLQYQRWTALPRVLVSKYEVMINDLAGEVERIAGHLGISLPAEKHKQVADEHKIERQKERIVNAKQKGALRAGVVDSVLFDPHTNLHTNHIHQGEIGGWKGTLSHEQVKLLEAKAAKWLEEHGYELVQDSPAMLV